MKGSGYKYQYRVVADKGNIYTGIDFMGERNCKEMAIKLVVYNYISFILVSFKVIWRKIWLLAFVGRRCTKAIVCKSVKI